VGVRGSHANRAHRRSGPEQIANRIQLDFPDDESMRISHEAIYQALYIEGRGALKRELVWCLRTGRALRAPRERSRRKTWAHVTPETLISERPAEAEDRATHSLTEGDLVIGLERSAISDQRSAPWSSERLDSRSWFTCPESPATDTSTLPRTAPRSPASIAAWRSHFDNVIAWIPKSSAICSSVTSASRLRATRTTSSRNSLGLGLGIVTSFQTCPSGKPEGLPRLKGTSEMACSMSRSGRMNPCPSPIPKSFATMS